MPKHFYVLSVPKKMLLYILLSFSMVLLLVQWNKLNIKPIHNRVDHTMIPQVNYTPEHEVKGRIAIIIDDFGNNSAGTKEMVSINRPLTCAVIPFLKSTKTDAKLAFKNGHEIIIHLPMEPHVGNPNWLGKKGITHQLTSKEISEIVTEAIKDVPYAVGINNHMGSKATEDKRILTAVIKVLRDKKMYIIDSKTSQNSKVAEIAQRYQVPYLERMVFLDNKKDIGYIKGQLRLLGEIAIRNGYAIGIGHVGSEGGVVTAKAIQEMIPELEKMGIKIVPASELINR